MCVYMAKKLKILYIIICLKVKLLLIFKLVLPLSLFMHDYLEF